MLTINESTRDVGGAVLGWVDVALNEHAVVAMAAQQTMTADLAAVEQHTTDRHTGQRAPHVR
ncbi:hypothetical protein [Mycobacterium tuberculosis]|uniref:hypothetical protein n=1 Tax=Mycobacterium tuberculosis TaxID=1773 RepID=UPI001F408A5E|nr:hypothetical protein [Mycobacterium tuberculosis]